MVFTRLPAGHDALMRSWCLRGSRQGVAYGDIAVTMPAPRA